MVETRHCVQRHRFIVVIMSAWSLVVFQWRWSHTLVQQRVNSNSGPSHPCSDSADSTTIVEPPNVLFDYSRNDPDMVLLTAWRQQRRVTMTCSSRSVSPSGSQNLSPKVLHRDSCGDQSTSWWAEGACCWQYLNRCHRSWIASMGSLVHCNLSVVGLALLLQHTFKQTYCSLGNDWLVEWLTDRLNANNVCTVLIDEHRHHCCALFVCHLMIWLNTFCNCFCYLGRQYSSYFWNIWRTSVHLSTVRLQGRQSASSFEIPAQVRRRCT